MKIFRVKKDFRYQGGLGILVMFHYKVGDIFYEEIEKDSRWPDGKVTYNTFYYPANGSYAAWENEDFKFVDEYLECIGETDKSKDYFINQKFTQAQVDEMLKNNSNQ